MEFNVISEELQQNILLKMNFNLDNLDSLDLIQLILEIEKYFNISIPDDKLYINNFTSIKSIALLIKELKK